MISTLPTADRASHPTEGIWTEVAEHLLKRISKIERVTKQCWDVYIHHGIEYYSLSRTVLMWWLAVCSEEHDLDVCTSICRAYHLWTVEDDHNIRRFIDPLLLACGFHPLRQHIVEARAAISLGRLETAGEHISAAQSLSRTLEFWIERVVLDMTLLMDSVKVIEATIGEGSQVDMARCEYDIIRCQKEEMENLSTLEEWAARIYCWLASGVPKV